MAENKTGPDLATLRREYGEHGLDVPDLDPDPLAMFRRWLDDSVAAGLHEPNAMVVATASAEGRPSSRMVLLKGLDSRGFVFFTNYESRKAADIAANPHVSLLFPWHDLQRQVRVEGTAAKVSAEESAAYFASRPREAQLGAWASPQSRVVASRAALDERYGGVLAQFAGLDEVPVPPHWGGFRVTPWAVEFWQGRKGRMHDRLVYRRGGDAGDPHAPWSVERLAP
jgi:pyridoxamine 5'-phosphate oxidase